MLNDESPDSVVRAVSVAPATHSKVNESEAADQDDENSVQGSASVSLLGQGLRSLVDLKERIPREIAQRGIECVQELNLYNNDLVSIAELAAARGLVSLNVAANNLHKFEIETLRQLHRLRVLDMGSNCLSNVNGVHELKTLRTFDVSYNKLSDLAAFSSNGVTLTSILRRTAGATSDDQDNLEVVHRHKAEDVPSSPSSFHGHELQRLALHGNSIAAVEELSHLTGYPRLERLTLYSEPIYGCDQNKLVKDPAYHAAVGLLLPTLEFLDGARFDRIKAVSEFRISQRTNRHPHGVSSSDVDGAKGSGNEEEFEPLRAIQEQLQDIQRLKLDMQEIRLDSLEHRIGMAAEPQRSRTSPSGSQVLRSTTNHFEDFEAAFEGSTGKKRDTGGSNNPWDRPSRYSRTSARRRAGQAHTHSSESARESGERRFDSAPQTNATSFDHSETAAPTIQVVPRKIRSFHEVSTQTKKVILPEDVHRAHQLVALRMHLSEQHTSSEKTAAFAAALARSLEKVEAFFCKSLGQAERLKNLWRNRHGEATSELDVDKDPASVHSNSAESASGPRQILPFFVHGRASNSAEHSVPSGMHGQQHQRVSSASQKQPLPRHQDNTSKNRSLPRSLRPEYHALSHQAQAAVEMATATTRANEQALQEADAVHQKLVQQLALRANEIDDRTAEWEAEKAHAEEEAIAAASAQENAQKLLDELKALRAQDWENQFQRLESQLAEERQQHRAEVVALASNNDAVVDAMAEKIEAIRQQIALEAEASVAKVNEEVAEEAARHTELSNALAAKAEEAKQLAQAESSKRTELEAKLTNLQKDMDTIHSSCAEWEATARRRGDAADRAEGLLKQSMHEVSTLKQELALQHKRLTEEAAAERRMLQQQFESKLESQQVIELAQAAAAQQALRGAELVQSQLSERAACLAAELDRARKDGIAVQSDASRQVVRLRESLLSKSQRLDEVEEKLRASTAREQRSQSLNTRLAAMVKAQKVQAEQVARENASVVDEMNQLRTRAAQADAARAATIAELNQLRQHEAEAAAAAEAERVAAQKAREAAAELEIELEDMKAQCATAEMTGKLQAEQQASAISTKMHMLLSKYKENQSECQGLTKQLENERQDRRAQDILLKDQQESLLAMRAKLRDAEEQLRRALQRKEEVKADGEELRRQVRLQTELAEEYRGIARDLQQRQADLLQQHEEELAAVAAAAEERSHGISQEQHEEEMQALRKVVQEKQRALDFASQEVGKLDGVWRNKVLKLETDVSRAKEAADRAVIEAKRLAQEELDIEKRRLTAALDRSREETERWRQQAQSVQDQLEQLEQQKLVMTQKIKKMSSLFNSFIA